MRVWSRMALATAAGTWMIPASLCLAQVDEPAPAPKAEKPAAASSKSVETNEEAGASAGGRSVRLDVEIRGLGNQGCDVEVKPGNAACRFKKQSRHMADDGKLSFHFREVQFSGVDRNCTFAIVIRERGQAPKTVYRGFRLAADPSGDRTETFTCTMSSPSKVAGLEREGRIIR